MLERLKNYDFTLIIIPILLAGFGIVMIYSASMVSAVVEGHEGTYFMVRQIVWFIIGLFVFTFFAIFPYQNYQKLMPFIVVGVIVMLLAVLLFGNEVNNAKSWFTIGPMSMQPAEFAKLGLIMYLAGIYSKKQSYIDHFSRAVAPPLVMTGIILALIVLQPDIGTAAIIFLIASTVIFSSGIRWRHLAILLAIGGLLVAVAAPFMVTEERLSRFSGAYHPFETPDSDGYQLIQSYVAIGSGGLIGEGLGNSVQKLGYLMEAHTDFIMAVIAEELGFIGVVIVIGMLAIIVLRGIFYARKTRDSFASLLAIGISSLIGIQSFINLGAISGILPITGVPLPFVSYGGSSLLIMMSSVGILNNIAMQVNKQEDGKEVKTPSISKNKTTRSVRR